VEASLFTGTPPPRPRGATFSFPLTAYLVFSLPFDELSEMDADLLSEVLRRSTGLNSEFSWEMKVCKSDLLPLPFVELECEVPRLASLEVVSCLEGSPLSLAPTPGAGRQPARASWGFRSGSFCFWAVFFSFFSISLVTALRLRAPLADMLERLDPRIKTSEEGKMCCSGNYTKRLSGRRASGGVGVNGRGTDAAWRNGKLKCTCSHE
jgi:hypothetical protein